MNTISTAEVLQKVKNAVSATETAKNGYDRGEAEKQMETAKLLVLASIAQSLDNLVRNGLTVEHP